MSDDRPHAPFPHLDPLGGARMVDVGDKDSTDRLAVASGRIRMAASTLGAIRDGRVSKGDVLQIARIAAVIGAKRTADVIPLCHPIALTGIEIDTTLDDALPGVAVQATVRARDRTGVEMEALTAVSAALLTVYDMCKSLDRGMVVEHVRLERKEGGRSGIWLRDS